MPTNDDVKVELLPTSYRDVDLSRACLFTGTPVKSKKRGEHVIARWLHKVYDLADLSLEVGSRTSLARVLEFTAPALPKANEHFGTLEERVKDGQASHDELHLWAMKMSAGMIWNHHRLSLNSRHPNAPGAIDDRHVRIALLQFNRAYASWRSGSYVRSGGILILPTRSAQFFLVHLFGAIEDHGLLPNHDIIAPYGMFAIRLGNQIVVASFYDDERYLETGVLSSQWSDPALGTETNPTRIRAALATGYFYDVYSRHRFEVTGDPPEDAELRDIAYQLGIVIEEKNGELVYSDRSLGGER